MVAKHLIAMPKSPNQTASLAPRRQSHQRRGGNSQIERKRELDRIAQRVSRERTRNRVRFLEDKLKSLEARDNQGQLSHLMEVIKKLQDENMELKSVMMKIGHLVTDPGGSTESM